MKKQLFTKTAVLLLLLTLALSGCGKKADTPSSGNADNSGTTKDTEDSRESDPGQEAGTSDDAEDEDASPEDENSGESEYTPEEMDLIKYNYYVDLNNDIVEILDSIDYYFWVVEDAEEFSLIPDSGYTYGYQIYGVNSDIIDDCLQLADMDPDYGELDSLVKEMAEPLRVLMDTFLEINGSYDYADNQYQKAKEYHAAIYGVIDTFLPLGEQYMDSMSALGDSKTAEEEAQMKAEGRLIIYNASRAISIGGQIMDVIYDQDVTDENITDLDLTEINNLYQELVTVVGEFDAATADTEQLVKESLSNSTPFDGLYDSLIQALEWMIKQVESGQPLDLSGSGAPLGSIGHFSETLDKCIDRYNSVFVE